MYVEKYSARHCLRRNLAVHYAANNSVQHTQTPNTAANICVSLRGSAKNIPVHLYPSHKQHRANIKIGSVQVQGSLPCSGGSKGG